MNPPDLLKDCQILRVPEMWEKGQVSVTLAGRPAVKTVLWRAMRNRAGMEKVSNRQGVRRWNRCDEVSHEDGRTTPEGLCDSEPLHPFQVSSFAGGR